MNPMADEQRAFKCIIVPGLIFELRADGWRYAEWTTRAPRRGEPDRPQPEPDFRGPFRNADEAARDFAATMGAQYGDLGFASIVPPEAPAMFHDHEVQAMFKALESYLPPRGRRPK
jgi:hypothetical protein